MKGWITLTHHVSGEKLHIQTRNIIGIRECAKANLILLKGANGMYISESAEAFFQLLKLEEEE